MAEKPHSSKSIMYVVIAITVLLLVVALPLSKLGKGSVSVNDSESAESRIQPVARFDLQREAAPAGDGKPRDGETVYKTVCAACHSTGAAGAPKTGDKAAWAPRIATGVPSLIKSVLGGKGAMPPKGGSANLTEEEAKGAVEYLVGKAK